MAFNNFSSRVKAGEVVHVNGRLDYYDEHALGSGNISFPEAFIYSSLHFTDDDIEEGSFRFSSLVNDTGEYRGGGLVNNFVSFNLLNIDGHINLDKYFEKGLRGRLYIQYWVNDGNGGKLYVNAPTFYPSSVKRRKTQSILKHTTASTF